MLKITSSFSSFSVNDLNKAKDFYGEVLGLKVVEKDGMGLDITLPSGGKVFAYLKPNHEPATFTILNFCVGNIDTTVEELTKVGIHFEHYDGEIKTDEKGIARSSTPDKGPTIAWFKDPAGNILSIIETEND